VVVVGAGPAGLMGAIAAARAGRRVCVCERLPRPGAKLLASGGGRCNLTNLSGERDFVSSFGRQGRFILPALHRLGPAELRGFFAELGVPTRSDDGVHVYPASNRSADVLNTLLGECRRLGVVLRLGEPVAALRLEAGRAVGVETAGGFVPAGRVIVAAGGKGYRSLGGTGDGYALARQAGHDVVEPTPALVALTTREAWPRSCAGLAVAGARLCIDLPRFRGERRTGDVLFTHTGISGPAVLDLSGSVAELLRERPAVPIRVSFRPDVTADQWFERFEAWAEAGEKRLVRNLVACELPARLADVICLAAGGAGDLRPPELSRAKRAQLAAGLTATPLTVTATAGFEQAMVTRGGVALKQVEPHTLASRLVEGLHFAGEVLDLDGPCGGYNLQWAFASGHLAGVSCAGEGRERV